MPNRKLLAALLLALSLAAHGGPVQTSNFRAIVPFDFVIGSQTLPAGSYLVQRLPGNHSPLDFTAVVVIKSANNQIRRTVITRLKPDIPRDAARVSTLVFAIFNGVQYLSQIRLAGEKATDVIETPADTASLLARPIREVKLMSLR